MGIYIKNMEIPKEFDPDVYIELACGIDGNRYARLYNFHYGGLTEWCEIISVPSHGDLIDRKELTKNDHQHYEYMSDEFYVTVLDIESAPTIIPAEEDKR